MQMRTTKKLTRASTNPSGSRKLEFDGSRGRGVTDEGLLELAMVLNEPQTNIEGLSLRYMKLSDEACAALADAIKVNWTLGRFELHGTSAAPAGARPPACDTQLPPCVYLGGVRRAPVLLPRRCGVIVLSVHRYADLFRELPKVCRLSPTPPKTVHPGRRGWARP